MGVGKPPPLCARPSNAAAATFTQPPPTILPLQCGGPRDEFDPAPDCAACSNITGRCTKCTNFPLVNGVCKPCTAKDCKSCPMDPRKCVECRDYYGLKNGVCKLCADKNCKLCGKDAGKCTECDGIALFRAVPTGFKNGKKGAQVRCSRDGPCSCAAEPPPAAAGPTAIAACSSWPHRHCCPLLLAHVRSA